MLTPNRRRGGAQLIPARITTHALPSERFELRLASCA